MRIHVTVSAKDYESGVRCDSWLCPVARALWRATGWKWVVSRTNAYPLGMPGLQVRLPEVATQFLIDFDLDLVSRRKFEPFEFDLEIDAAAAVAGERAVNERIRGGDNNV